MAGSMTSWWSIKRLVVVNRSEMSYGIRKLHSSIVSATESALAPVTPSSQYIIISRRIGQLFETVKTPDWVWGYAFLLKFAAVLLQFSTRVIRFAVVVTICSSYNYVQFASQHTLMLTVYNMTISIWRRSDPITDFRDQLSIMVSIWFT